MPPAARAAAPEAAAAAAHAAAAGPAARGGPTALLDQAPLPGWGDLRCRAALDLAAAPLRSLGLQPPPLPPYASPAPALEGALAVCVRCAPTLIHAPATRLDARTVALRASRARTELLRSADFLPEPALRAYMRALEAEEAAAGAAAAAVAAVAVAADGSEPAAAPAAAAAAAAAPHSLSVRSSGGGGSGGGGSKPRHSSLYYEKDRVERRQRFIALVRSGKVPALEGLRISGVEAAALGLSAAWPYYGEDEGAEAAAAGAAATAVVAEVAGGEGGAAAAAAASGEDSSSSSSSATAAAAAALPLHLVGAAALAVTDPLTLCKRVAGGGGVGTLCARKKWELGVEAGIQHLPTLSTCEVPDAAWVIRK